MWIYGVDYGEKDGAHQKVTASPKKMSYEQKTNIMKNNFKDRNFKIEYIYERSLQKCDPHLKNRKIQKQKKREKSPKIEQILTF